MNEKYTLLWSKQQDFFKTSQTYDVTYRIAALRKLKSALDKWENEILEALKEDLGKAPFEGYETELGICHAEIKHLLKHVKKWSVPERKATPIVHFPSSSYILKDPKGVVLIMSPWNYPLQLTICPLAAALAAGCTAVIKPSRYSKETSKVLSKMIEETFEEKYVSVVEGGHDVNEALLSLKWDHIFFTGSPRVGRVVMEAAAKSVTPVTLELGGKSPVIIDKSANLKLAATRLAWGKFLNAGQTCVAPDYVLIEKGLEDEFTSYFKEAIERMYSKKPLESPDLPKIINEHHYERLKSLLKCGKAVIGADYDDNSRRISPTLLRDVPLDSEVMKEEIFGPILPLISVSSVDEAISFIRDRESPLALYIFSSDKKAIKKIHRLCRFGGGCINDAVVHLSNPNIPFGGVGNSGLGSYHAKAGFDTFTHEKSILKKGLFPDIPIRYAPYGDKLKLIRKLLH